MQQPNHFLLMAQYNLRMNGQVFEAARQLSSQDLTENKGAYFGSIIGTLNHLLVGDLIWLNRFATHSDTYLSLQALTEFPITTKLDTIIYPEIESLYVARQVLDNILIKWLSTEVKEEDLSAPHTYTNTKGVQSTRNFAELLNHLFNHQTHHRGQVSTLLNQLNVDIGVTDFLIDIPEVKQ
ncbi:DinB family protein [Paraglaciecola sp. L3A3]|uniref:DinB family protein n=1 Tax=Paraglaciecola sp. L3A3 TaxID=2686358 RepID=UPI00131C0833|nr:DinB family protein [Paraglaciecola sp. L3A3]